MTARFLTIAAVLVALLSGVAWLVYTVGENRAMRVTIEDQADTIAGQQIAILAQADNAVLTGQLNIRLRQRGVVINRQLKTAIQQLGELKTSEQQSVCDDTPLPAGYADGLRGLTRQLFGGEADP